MNKFIINTINLIYVAGFLAMFAFTIKCIIQS